MSSATIAAARESIASGEPILLRVTELAQEFERDDGACAQAVSGVSLELRRGESLGLVGESGCGKSSLARAILQLPRPRSGSVVFEGVDLTRLGRTALRPYRRRLQMVFQDPISSLNPRRRVGEIVAEPLRIWGEVAQTEVHRRVRDVLEAVGLAASDVWNRRPHEFSGGQCQRISLARALILKPALLICDEPVSSLDVSVQAQILNLLHDMKAQYGFSMLFISHDLAVIKNVSDRVAVMYLGKFVEAGPTERIFRRPRHPYTRGLMESVLTAGGKLPDHEGIPGELPSAIDPPSGCRFRTRCPRSEPKCAQVEPAPAPIGHGHSVACHFPIA